MFDNIVAFQIIGGCAAVATVGGTAIYTIQSFNSVEQPSEGLDQKVDVPDFYYLAHVKSASNNSPTAELYTNDVKNFQCQWSDNKETIIDTECEVYKLDNRTNTETLLTVNDITEPFTKVKKADFSSEGTLLKVKINNEKFNYFSWKEGTEINLKSNKKNEAGKSYGSFVVNYQTITTNITGTTNLVIAKIDDVEEETTIEKNSTYGCLFHEKTLDLENCEIFEIPDQPSNSKSYKNIKINKLAKITEKSKFTKDKYIVVDLKLEKPNMKNLNYLLQGKKLSVLTQTKKEPPIIKRLGGFSIVGTLYNVEDFTPSSSKTMLLDVVED